MQTMHTMHAMHAINAMHAMPSEAICFEPFLLVLDFRKKFNGVIIICDHNEPLRLLPLIEAQRNKNREAGE